MKEISLISGSWCACSGTIFCTALLLFCNQDGAARYRNTGFNSLCVLNYAREAPLILFGADKLSQPTRNMIFTSSQTINLDITSIIIKINIDTTIIIIKSCCQ